jgi:hypothetical protein
VTWSLLPRVLVLSPIAGIFVMALQQNLPEPDARALAFAARVATNRMCSSRSPAGLHPNLVMPQHSSVNM